jgi:hypothetical protein
LVSFGTGRIIISVVFCEYSRFMNNQQPHRTNSSIWPRNEKTVYQYLNK